MSVKMNLASEQVLKPLSGNWMVKVLTDVVLGYEGVTLQLCFNSLYCKRVFYVFVAISLVANCSVWTL